MITTINPDLSSHTVDGDVECHLASWNPETQQPFTSESEVRAYVASVRARPFFFLPVPTAEEKARRAEADAIAQREQAKAARDTAVAAITVEVDGLTFDGDEVSQGRIARAILALESAGMATTQWTLSNNAKQSVTIAQLRTALVKAGLAQTALWPI